MKRVHQAHPSPQRTPIIFQAGASKGGIAFGGKHAEAIFCYHSTIASQTSRNIHPQSGQQLLQKEEIPNC